MDEGLRGGWRMKLGWGCDSGVKVGVQERAWGRGAGERKGS